MYYIEHPFNHYLARATITPAITIRIIPKVVVTLGKASPKKSPTMIEKRILV
jgi:hypothetical protein